MKKTTIIGILASVMFLCLGSLTILGYILIARNYESNAWGYLLSVGCLVVEFVVIFVPTLILIRRVPNPARGATALFIPMGALGLVLLFSLLSVLVGVLLSLEPGTFTIVLAMLLLAMTFGMTFALLWGQVEVTFQAEETQRTQDHKAFESALPLLHEVKGNLAEVRFTDSALLPLRGRLEKNLRAIENALLNAAGYLRESISAETVRTELAAVNEGLFAMRTEPPSEAKLNDLLRRVDKVLYTLSAPR